MTTTRDPDGVEAVPAAAERDELAGGLPAGRASPLTDCHMLLEETGGGSRTVFVEAGTTYRRDQGVEHNVINNGDTPMSFVEVELK